MLARFWTKVEKTDTCWNWLGFRRRGRAPGYGDFSINGRSRPAHRIAYELFVGPIPDGLVIDHLCRNPSCVRPDHLEAVDNRTNVIDRGTGPFAEKSRQTHCVNGHEFTPENTWIRRDSKRGTRNCRTCYRERSNRYYHARIARGRAAPVSS